MAFVSREMELQLLGDLHRRAGAQFLILSGRRRIGKTRLVTHWGKQLEKPYFYWMATQTSTTNQLRDFSQALFRFLNPGSTSAPTFSYGSWDAALTELGRAAASRRLVAVLDEFTYVMQANPEVPSLLQRAWDHGLQQTNLFLIVMGSLAGIIQRSALDYQSPLYGRATARLKLQPLGFGALAALLPRFTAEQRVATYAITGGVPAYIEMFDDGLNILENLRQRIVTPTNVMLNDAVFLLHEQLDDPRNYIALIEAIAAGFHSLGDIVKMAGLDRSNVTKYLAVLRELGYVERIVPATVQRPERSRKGRYVLTDPYLRFYYRFLAGQKGNIEQGRVRQVTSLLHDHLLDFIGTHTFEELSREWLAVRAEQGELPFLPERIGSHWSRNAQVDVVAINWRSSDILLGECKWGHRPVGKDVIQTLLAKRERVLPKGKRWTVHYICFAREAFTPKALALAQEEGVRCVTLADLEGELTAASRT